MKTGTNLTYAWNFGDGNTQSTSQQTVTHRYYKKGSGTSAYHANLNVSGDQKNTATDSVGITVKDASLFIKVEEPSQDQRFARMVSVNPMKIKVSLKGPATLFLGERFL